MELPPKQKIVFDFLKSHSANGTIKISNDKIAKELAETNLIVPAASYASISEILSRLETKRLIRREQGKTTRDRIIYILESQNK
jgi:DNA-binding PadR family transcriptional regulator